MELDPEALMFSLGGREVGVEVGLGLQLLEG